MAQSHKGEKIRSYSVAFKIGVIEWYRREGTQNTAKMLKRSLRIEKEFVNGIKGMMFCLKPILEWGKRKGNCIGGAVFSAAVDSEVFFFLGP